MADALQCIILPDKYEDHTHVHALDRHAHVLPHAPVLSPMVENIKEALIEADPEHKEGYEKNADIYLKKLQELDSTFRESPF